MFTDSLFHDPQVLAHTAQTQTFFFLLFSFTRRVLVQPLGTAQSAKVLLMSNIGAARWVIV